MADGLDPTTAPNGLGLILWGMALGAMMALGPSLLLRPKTTATMLITGIEMINSGTELRIENARMWNGQ